MEAREEHGKMQLPQRPGGDGGAGGVIKVHYMYMEPLQNKQKNVRHIPSAFPPSQAKGSS